MSQRNTYKVEMNVYVRAKDIHHLPTQRDVEDKISNLLLGMPRLTDVVLEPDDECPNCKCGTLESQVTDEGPRLVCSGGCGQIISCCQDWYVSGTSLPAEHVGKFVWS